MSLERGRDGWQHMGVSENPGIIGDGLAFVRQNPSMFFEQGGYTPEALAALVEREARAAGAKQVTVHLMGEWMAVHSPTDWLAECEAEAFYKVVPFPAGGENAMRVEVLATAFASDVVTTASGLTTAVKGRSDVAVVKWMLGQGGRSVAFR